jgi:hypothetical protein
MQECAAYIPDMSCEDSKRARHRQRQAAYEVRFATATEAEQFLMGYRRCHCYAIGGAAGCVMLRDDVTCPIVW